MLGIKLTRSFILMGVLMAVFAIAAVACASEPEATPAPAAAPALSEDQLRSIVSDAVAQSQPAPQQQISAQEISTMVSTAMAAMTSSQVSAAEIQSMVESAVSEAASQGASPEEIQTMVESAVMAATADSVTGEDVGAAINRAVRDAQSGMITSADVQAAVEGAREGAVTSADVQAAVSSAVMEAAANSLTAEQIEEIVSKALEERAMMADVPRETIVFSDLNWPSAQVQNRIVQYIAEHGYGYPTDVILGGTLPNFEGLKNGDIHVTMEIWLPNQGLGWEEAVEIGNVVSVGTSLVGDWQSTFVIPKYIADAHPDLKTPEDLKKPEYQELFATADSGGKARLVGCVLTWSCAKVNEEQIETYGLNDSIHLINAGSTAALNADIYGKYERMEPWLGYQWGTNSPALELDLVLLEQEPYTKECWAADKACYFDYSLVLVAVHKSLLPRAPEIIELLQNWEYSVPTHKGLLQWMLADDSREAAGAAIYYLKTTTAWESWISAEALGRVRAALESEA